jgi:hypothetical protein
MARLAWLQRADTTLKYPSLDLYYGHEVVQQQPDRPFVVNMPSSGSDLTKIMDHDCSQATVSPLTWHAFVVNMPSSGPDLIKMYLTGEDVGTATVVFFVRCERGLKSFLVQNCFLS